MEDAILRQRQHGGGGGGGNASLPEHVIFDVLSWLPAKPLCRFRCVSKAWRALISDPAFVAAQRSRAGPLLIGVFHGPQKPIMHMPWYRDTLELRVMDMHGNVLRVVDDVDQTKLQRMRLGLVCLAHQVFDTGAAMDPATARALRIGGYLDDPAADDPMIQFSTFGRAMPSGMYKAVRIYDKFCQIATLEEGAGGGAELTWRQGPAAPFLPCCSSRCTPMEDGVYFLPCSIHCFVPGRNRVAAFDLETEEWKPVIQFPRATMWPTCLVELNGTLAMVESEEGLCQTNVWLLVDSEKSIWIKQHVIQMHKSWRIEPLEVLGDGRVLLMNLVEKQRQGSHRLTLRWILQLRDPNTGAHTDLVEMPREYKGQMALYRGSLLRCSSAF
ncbi:hypothetical protein HU200_008467 [Digitaria exilis]|uniref:F-box domain-containing protein n=1 Tax=Digitaria exilis TaxID=1010633 RepID=A0A835ALP3_9POAL|nr:hypothetical protein HU200_059082 [Digitaria exilis]KAF8765527.1 hypothetical protein HU200_008467 [Digitaria exilis]